MHWSSSSPPSLSSSSGRADTHPSDKCCSTNSCNSDLLSLERTGTGRCQKLPKITASGFFRWHGAERSYAFNASASFHAVVNFSEHGGGSSSLRCQRFRRCKRIQGTACLVTGVILGIVTMNTNVNPVIVIIILQLRQF